MKWPTFRPAIWKRVLLTLLVSSGAVWCTIYLQGMYLTHKAVSGSFDQEMLGFSDALVDVVDRWGDSEQLDVALDGLSRGLVAASARDRTADGFEMFYVWRNDGALVAKSAYGDGGYRAAFLPPGFVDKATPNGNARVLAAWSKSKAHYIEVLQTNASRTAQYNSVMLSSESLYLFVLGLPFLMVPAWFATRTGLKPLNTLAAELRQRHPDSLQPVRLPARYVEIEPLVDGFNAALQQLDALLKRERDFLADAAHELRTPIAVITTQWDNFTRASDLTTKADAEIALKKGLQRAARVVHQLLDLATLEATIESSAIQIDVADIARDCLAAHAAAASAKAIELAYIGPEKIPLVLPLHAMEAILDNLVSNAVRYGRHQGAVEIHVTVVDDRLVVTVVDDGPGIDMAERPRLFQRFQRGRENQVSGSGLGLAIVASAARQLGAVISARAGLAGLGVAFVVDIPVVAGGVGETVKPQL
jgi:two-component system, OmpR family, sensor histidine kinase QseC